MSRTAPLFRPWLAAIVLVVCSVARSQPAADIADFFVGYLTAQP